MKPQDAWLGLEQGKVQSRQGFTLVEMLVALVLLGLLSVVLFSSFRLGMRAWEAGTVSAWQTSEIEVVQTLLRKELSEATQLPIGTGEARTDFTFAGFSDEVQFSAPMLAHLGMGGYHVIALSTDGPGASQDLVFRWRVYRPDMSLMDERWRDPLVLLHDIAGINLEYFGRYEDEETSTWRDTWDHQETLPDLIRLQVAFPTTDRRRWPELIVALKTKRLELMQ